MKFWITVNFKVDSNNAINKTLFFKYKKGTKKDYFDIARITNNKIVIEGSRYDDFSLSKCLRTKKSNYKRCLISSLFYIYNYFGEKIEIESITLTGKNKKGHNLTWNKLQYIQEFNLNKLSPNLKIDCNLIECLFDKYKYRSINKMIYNVLISQACYVRNNDFYYAYRALNAVYTFIYSYAEEFSTMTNRDTYADSVPIYHILKSGNFNKSLVKSINIAENYFHNCKNEILKSNISRLTKKEDKFLKEVGFEDFDYEDTKLLEFLGELFEEKYNYSIDEYHRELETEYQNAIREYLDKQKDPIANEKELKKIESKKSRLKQLIKQIESFTNKRDKKGNSQSINILQFFILFALYKRNKTLHGEQFDSLFCIHDTNVDEINELSNIVFQTCVELLNNLDLNEYINK